MKIMHKGKFTSVPFKKKVSNLRPNKKRPKQTEEKEQTEKREEFQQASWRDGRRIVELGLLADRLKECRLRRCRQPLHLSDVTLIIRVFCTTAQSAPGKPDINCFWLTGRRDMPWTKRSSDPSQMLVFLTNYQPQYLFI